MSCSITYEHVSYTYDDGTEALRDVSFMLSHGEHVALLGPNGAGKSTIMLLSNGVLLPQAGNVRVGDTLLGPKTLVEIRRRVGLLFQDPDDQLFMTTLYDDVAFGPLNNPPRNHAPQNHAPLSNASRNHAPLSNAGDRDDRDPVKSLVDDALAAVSLIEFAGKAPQDLSFGQKKRAALACVLAMQPDFLILDEPSSNLDPRGRRQMMELIRGIEGTVLIATHDLDLVWELLGRSIILDGGQVVADGPTRELLRDRELVEAHGLELPAAVRYG